MDGITVVDFTQILAGPFCTQLLADAGATVLKVEPPGGEAGRKRGPRRFDAHGNSLSSYNAAVNRGKRSIVLDLKDPRGLEIALDLISKADVVVENFRPNVITRLGIDYEALTAANPRLIAVSISLYGGEATAGALAQRGGLAIIAEAEGSLLGMTRDSNNQPIQTRAAIGDMSVGLTAYAAIATALFDRERTGRGQIIEVPMVSTILSFNAAAIAAAEIVEGDTDKSQKALRTAGYGVFRTADGHAAVGCNSDRMFERLARAIDQAWMLDDPRLNNYAHRDAHVDEVDGYVTAWTSAHTTDEVVAHLEHHAVPCGRVNTPADVLDDKVLRELGYIDHVIDGLGGSVRVPANPLGLRRPGSAVPRQGEHSDEIMADVLGRAPAEIDALRAERVVQ